MKRILVFLIAIASVSMYAQSGSIISDSSYGLFTNEFDEAFTVDSDFGEMELMYLFFGLHNNSETTVTGNEANFSAGLYLPGEEAFAAFAEIDLVSASNTANSVIDTTGIVVDGTTTYEYITTLANTTYLYPVVNNIDLNTKLIFGGADSAIGFDIDLAYNNYAAGTDSFYRETTYSYNTAASGAPVTATDYTQTVDRKQINDFWSFRAGLEFYGEFAGMTHTAEPSIQWAFNNDSQYRKTTYSGGPADPATGAGTLFLVGNDQELTDMSHYVRLGITDSIILDPLFELSQKDEMYIGGELAVRAGFTVYDNLETDKQFTYNGAGDTALTEVLNDITQTKLSYGLIDYTYLRLIAGQKSYFTPVEGIEFAFDASVDTRYYFFMPENTVYRNESIVKTNGDGNAAIDSAADSVVTTVTEYSENGGVYRHDVDMYFYLESAVKIQPADLPFGIVLGARPYFQFGPEFRITEGIVYKQTVTTVDGAGAPVSEATEERTAGAGRSEIYYYSSAGVNHSISFFWDITENASAYFKLNGNNLLDLESIDVQFILGL